MVTVFSLSDNGAVKRRPRVLLRYLSESADYTNHDVCQFRYSVRDGATTEYKNWTWIFSFLFFYILYQHQNNILTLITFTEVFLLIVSGWTWGYNSNNQRRYVINVTWVYIDLAKIRTFAGYIKLQSIFLKLTKIKVFLHPLTILANNMMRVSFINVSLLLQKNGWRKKRAKWRRRDK